jgi:hypothetical protein
MLVLVENAAETVTSSYVEVGQLVWISGPRGQRGQRSRVREALMRPVSVVELFELAQAWSRCRWFQIKVRSNSSRRQVCTHRSMIEFIRGIRTPLRTTAIPTSARTASTNSGNLPSRSRIRNRARQPASSRSMTRFLTACVTHPAVACAMAPRIRIRRLPCSITANRYIRVPVRVTVSRKSQASKASAWERRKSAQVLAARSGAGSIPASFNICHTVDAATFTPSTSSSPWSRRYPQLGFSCARRGTRRRTERAAGGRPGRFGRDRCAWRRASRSRCQRNTVSGRTSSRTRPSTMRGSR